MATSITLTGNFWATCRAFTFSDGGGISWAFDQNTNVLTGTVSAGASISLEDLTDVSVTPAQGDVLYYNGTDWTGLAPGTSGQYLETQGTSANPTWSTVSVTVMAGTGLSGGGSVSAGGSITLANAGVTSNVAGTGISVSAATGAVTISLTSNSVTVTAGTGLSGGGTVALGSSVTLTNAGVTSNVAGTGISVSAATGAVTISLSTPVSIGNGGTGQNSAVAAYNALSPMTTLGDIEYESAASTASRLAGNTTTTKKFLTQTGTGSVSAAPGWNTIVAGDIPTTLNGGLTLSTPGSSEQALTVNLYSGSVHGVQILGQSAANAYFDLYITRAGSTANNAQLGPNISFQDSTNSKYATVQLSGGQLEFWLNSGSWVQVLGLTGGPTTGSKTASFSASNKPGSNNQTTPAAWLPVVYNGGTVGYIPIFGA